MRPVVRPLQKQCVDNDVWNLLTPAVPDCLECLGGGVYQATWWKPVPVKDLEIMMGLKCVELLTEPFQPDNLPGGIAMRFSTTIHW